MTREKAWEKVTQMIKNPNLIKHCLAVESAMKGYAIYFDVPESESELWAVAGLLHDADYEAYPDKHPTVLTAWLEQEGEDVDLINAIASHGFELGVEANTRMARTLRAVDELTGLIVACALVRESKKLADVTVEGVLKKWKNAGFARGVNRSDIERGAAEIDVPLEKHIEIVLTAMQKDSDLLGL
ncbi:HD domain-containing protein [candidate division WWE3 bacterium]|nr:HD domain-containing protein [candidate division WWE3 bacterium]